MEKREQLVLKLNHVLSANGFAHLSMAKIAQLAGASRATLYGYFKNKDEIVEAVVGRHLMFINRNTKTPVSLTVEGYVTLRLNAQLLIGAQAPIFRDDLTQTMPALARRLEAAYQNFRQFTIEQLQLLKSAKIINDQFSPERLFRQDELFIPAVINDILTHHRPFIETEQLLTDYLTAELTGTVTDPQTILVALDKSKTFRHRIFDELAATYY
ncbi:TetR family transcriptional regulator [Secundilactobacillus kimchicus]|uniref:TetR/AcrR family transcriptional regulator n=1 Tax=Secundilactobacillus kimchicus TaxID=528209 RepID=UPI001C02B935|nr:TetR/AcrR family transcriptional regulator [Secundilactobacillus kimchicus]MBT9671190.1 TetR family transcriptional regulator [Secundilactobacillus kimchicus]